MESSRTGRWLAFAGGIPARHATMTAETNPFHRAGDRTKPKRPRGAGCLTAGILALVLAAPARAELHAGMHQLGLDLGLAAPVSKIDGANGSKETHGSAGARFGVQYLYHVRPGFALGLEVSNGIRAAKESTQLVANGISKIKGNSVLGLVLARWSFLEGSRLRPFVLGGVGLHRSTVKVETAPQGGLVWADTGTRESRPIFDGSGSGLGMALRGGLEFDVTGPFFAGMEGGWEYMGSAKYKSTAAGRTIGATDTSGTISHVSVFARVGARFGGLR